jgi:hypothetical protein
MLNSSHGSKTRNVVFLAGRAAAAGLTSCIPCLFGSRRTRGKYARFNLADGARASLNSGLVLDGARFRFPGPICYERDHHNRTSR